METVRDKADRMFAAAADKIALGQKTMHAQHAALGRLQSGITIREAVRIYEHETAFAIDELATAISQRIESRGRAWRKAIASLRKALASHASNGEALTASSIRLAARGSSDGLAVSLLNEANARLYTRLDDLAEGWTGPKGRKWNDRNPVLYALAMMVIGGVMTAAITAVVAMVNPSKTEPPKISQPSTKTRIWR